MFQTLSLSYCSCVCYCILFVVFSGISSLTFTKHGEALYMHSSSELQRVTVSATCLTVAMCCLELPPSARAPPVIPVVQTSESESSDSSSESSTSSSSESDDDEEEKGLAGHLPPSDH